jgi:hypothetical protein
VSQNRAFLLLFEHVVRLSNVKYQCSLTITLKCFWHTISTCTVRRNIKLNTIFKSLSYMRESILPIFMTTCAEFLQWLHLFGILSIKSICYCFSFSISKFEKSTHDGQTVGSVFLHKHIYMQKETSRRLCYMFALWFQFTSLQDICRELLQESQPFAVVPTAFIWLFRFTADVRETAVSQESDQASQSTKWQYHTVLWICPSNAMYSRTSGGTDNLHSLVGGYQPLTGTWFIQLCGTCSPCAHWIFYCNKTDNYII